MANLIRKILIFEREYPLGGTLAVSKASKACIQPHEVSSCQSDLMQYVCVHKNVFQTTIHAHTSIRTHTYKHTPNS